MGFLAHPNNQIVWNKETHRYEAWAFHTDRGLMLFSYDRGTPDGKMNPSWITSLWHHMLSQTDQLTHDHLKRGALFEFINATKRGAR